jgi:hypothetical protein
MKSEASQTNSSGVKLDKLIGLLEQIVAIQLYGGWPAPRKLRRNEVESVA